MPLPYGRGSVNPGWRTAEAAVITRFGKFPRIAEPGLNWKSPVFDSVAGIVSLRVNQITLTMETKTRDNVFRPEKVYEQELDAFP